MNLKKAEDKVSTEKQHLLQQEFEEHYEQEINVMNSSINTKDMLNKKFRRDDLMDDLNNWNDENVETEEYALFEEEIIFDTDDDIDPESLNPETSMDPDDPCLITNLQTELADLDEENDEFTSSEYMFINKKFYKNFVSIFIFINRKCLYSLCCP